MKGRLGVFCLAPALAIGFAIHGCTVTGTLPSTRATADPLPYGMAVMDAPSRPSSPPPMPIAAPVGGIIVDTQGQPAAGVKVILHPVGASEQAAAEIATVTAGDGTFRIEHPPDGLFNLEAVRSEEFKLFKRDIQVEPGDRLELGVLQLGQTGAIAGQIWNPDAPVAPALEGTDIFIPNSSFVAKADQAGLFVLRGVPPGSYQVVASGRGWATAAVDDVKVTPGGLVRVGKLALSPLRPVITSVIPRNAAPGATVSISGVALEGTYDLPVRVFFGGALASRVNLAGGQLAGREPALVVTVPERANSGDVLATAGGQASNGWPFQVQASLSVLPADSVLLEGRTLAVGAVAYDTAGARIAQPDLEWRLSGSCLQRRPDGVLGVSPGTASLSVHSGVLSAAAEIQVLRGQVDRLELASDSLSVGRFGAFPPRIDSRVVMADGSVNSLVAFSIPPGSPFDIDPEGGVRLLDEVASAVVAVRVASRLAPEKQATVSVRVRNVATVSTLSRMDDIRAVALAPDGTLLVADSTHLAAADPVTGALETLAGAKGVSMVVDGSDAMARFAAIRALAVGSGGAVWIADGERIRQRPPGGGVRSLLEGIGGDPDDEWISLAQLPDGNLGATSRYSSRVRILAFKPGPAPSLSCCAKVLGGPGAEFRDGPDPRFWLPRGLAAAPSGDLLVADLENYRIRRITPQFEASTLAGSSFGFSDGSASGALFASPQALALDTAGNVYVAESFTSLVFGTTTHGQGGCLIRQITPSGRVRTLAGSTPGLVDGPGSAAKFLNPIGIAVDAAGETVYVADSSSEGAWIRRIRF